MTTPTRPVTYIVSHYDERRATRKRGKRPELRGEVDLAADERATLLRIQFLDEHGQASSAFLSLARDGSAVTLTHDATDYSKPGGEWRTRTARLPIVTWPASLASDPVPPGRLTRAPKRRKARPA